MGIAIGNLCFQAYVYLSSDQKKSPRQYKIICIFLMFDIFSDFTMATAEEGSPHPKISQQFDKDSFKETLNKALVSGDTW